MSRLRPSSLGAVRTRPRSLPAARTLALAAVLTVAALGLLIALPWWQVQRGKSLVRTWATQHGYAIIEIDHRWILRGPYSWWKAKHQNVYHIELRDSTGQARTGYAKTGSLWLGTMLSNNVAVSLGRQN